MIQRSTSSRGPSRTELLEPVRGIGVYHLHFDRAHERRPGDPHQRGVGRSRALGLPRDFTDDVAGELRSRLYALMDRYGDPYGTGAAPPGTAEGERPNRYGRSACSLDIDVIGAGSEVRYDPDPPAFGGDQ